MSSSGSFKATENWLKRASNKIPTNAMRQIGSKGKSALAAATPRDSGITASGWNYEIQASLGGADLYFVNNAHPGLTINLALAIQMGHGTGTGGYVPPIDYINPAMSSIFSSAADLLVKEMIK